MYVSHVWVCIVNACISCTSACMYLYITIYAYEHVNKANKTYLSILSSIHIILRASITVEALWESGRDQKPPKKYPMSWME